MRKLIVLCIAMLVVVGLVGCGAASSANYETDELRVGIEISVINIEFYDHLVDQITALQMGLTPDVTGMKEALEAKEKAVDRYGALNPPRGMVEEHEAEYLKHVEAIEIGWALVEDVLNDDIESMSRNIEKLGS